MADALSTDALWADALWADALRADARWADRSGGLALGELESLAWVAQANGIDAAELEADVEAAASATVIDLRTELTQREPA